MIRINQDLCTACGICGHICPRHIPVTIENDDKKTTVYKFKRIASRKLAEVCYLE